MAETLQEEQFGREVWGMQHPKPVKVSQFVSGNDLLGPDSTVEIITG